MTQRDDEETATTPTRTKVLVVALLVGAGALGAFQSGLFGDPAPEPSVLAATDDDDLDEVLVPAVGAQAAAFDLPPPSHERTCCAFGMDLRAQLVGLDVPFFEIGNVVDPSALGAHEYRQPVDTASLENDGLVYTCRGGWIDTSHVRADADLAFFLAVHLAPVLEGGGEVLLPDGDARVRIRVAGVPHALVERIGVSHVVATLAAWIAFRISIWHELATWYGYETVLGFSEQLSAFSPEDLYSDALGARIGASLAFDPSVHQLEDYEQGFAVALGESLRRLGARDLASSRAIMSALDGRWWTSTRRVPDDRMVMRRALPPPGDVVRPWRAEQAPLARMPAALDACATAPTQALTIAADLDGVAARDLVDIAWTVDTWASPDFPFPDPATRVVHDADLDGLVARAHDSMQAALGPEFDHPD